MSRDLVFKETRCDWSRASSLTTAPLIPPAPESPAAAAVADTIASLKRADSLLKVRPRGRGLLVTKTVVFGKR